MQRWLLIACGLALCWLGAPASASAQDCASTCYSGSSCTQYCTDSQGGSSSCGAYNGWNCQGSCSNMCWGGAACDTNCIDSSGWTTCGALGASACVQCANGCGPGAFCSTQCYVGGTYTTCGGAGETCSGEALASGACASTAASSSITSGAPRLDSLADPAGKCRVTPSSSTPATSSIVGAEQSRQ